MNNIDKAFQTVKRVDYLTDDTKNLADIDDPLPIGFGQTNSQPTTVERMLKWLEPIPGEKILDVGSGSGWTTALIANLVGAYGSVFAVELVPELVRFGDENCQRAGIHNVHFFTAKKGVYGLPSHAPYDAILVSAAAEELPKVLLEQLKVNGRLVIPIKNSIFVIEKTSDNDYESIEHPGYVFVPLLKD